MLIKNIFSVVGLKILRPQLNNYYSPRMEIPFVFHKKRVNLQQLNLAIFRSRSDFAFTKVKSWSKKEFSLLKKSPPVSDVRDLFCFKPKLIIFIDFRALQLTRPLLEYVYQDFKGTFVLDPRDGGLLEKPDWIGPHSRWAAPHIPNPFSSSGLCLPIGVGELAINSTSLPHYFKYQPDKKGLVLVGPFGSTHSDREKFSSWRSTSVLDCRSKYLRPKNYARIASGFKFVVCPRGNGIDTHRFWETLYRGSIPIVEDSEWARYFQFHQIPMLVVKDFNELLTMKEVDFEEHWSNLSKNPSKIESLWPDYWLNLVERMNCDSM